MAVNKVKNRVIVENPAGDRAFILLEGDIFQERAEVYVFNAYHHDGGKLLADLRQMYGFDEIIETPFYCAPNGATVAKVRLASGRIILILRTELIEHKQISAGDYKTFIDIVFTSLMALETMGDKFESIAIPVLFRNGIAAIYPEAIKILAEKSTEWLKKSDNTKAIKMVLFKENDAEIWSENLNDVLGRRTVDSREQASLNDFKHRALTTLQLMSKKLPYWEDTLLPLQEAVDRRDFRPEVIAAFSRKLLEVYCIELCNTKGGQSGSLDAALKYIRNNALLNAWEIQNLYQIRSFGNPSIHRSETLIGPIAMNDRDITILLINVCRLLDMIYDFANVTHPYQFNEN